MKLNFRKLLPYLLICVVIGFTYFYSDLFINYDLDGFYGKEVDQKAYNFDLLSSSGKRVQLTDFGEQFLFLTFGFTRCTSVCPLNLHRFQSLSKKFLEQNLNVKFIFISFDAFRDNAKEIEDFVSKFSTPNIEGLLSGKDNTLDVATKFKNYISFNKEKIEENPNFQINHNGFLYLIDKASKLRLIYMQKDVDEQKIINDIKKLSLIK